MNLITTFDAAEPFPITPETFVLARQFAHVTHAAPRWFGGGDIATMHPSTAAGLLIASQQAPDDDQSGGTIIWIRTEDRGITARPIEPDPVDRVVGHLRTFKFLQRNWNGYEGVPPSDRAVEDCVHFLKQLMTRVLPDPMVGGDGEVGLFWENSEYAVEVGFMGDGHYSYCVMKAEDQSSFEDEGVNLDDLPEELETGLDRTAYLQSEKHERG